MQAVCLFFAFPSQALSLSDRAIALNTSQEPNQDADLDSDRKAKSKLSTFFTRRERDDDDEEMAMQPGAAAKHHIKYFVIKETFKTRNYSLFK